MLSFLFCVCAIGGPPIESGPNWVIDKDFPKPLQEKVVGATLRLVNPSMSNAEGTAVRIKRLGNGPYRVFYLTAAHNVFKANTVNLEGYKPETYPKIENNLQDVSIKKRWENIDLALLEGFEPQANECLDIVPASAIPNEKTFSTLTMGCSKGKPPVFSIDRVLGRFLVHKPDGSKGWYWQTQNIADEGRSGGPMVAANGYLIGICSGNGDKHGLYIESKEIREAVGGHAKILLEPTPPNRSIR